MITVLTMQLEQPEQTIKVYPDYPSLMASKTVRDREATIKKFRFNCGSYETMMVSNHGCRIKVPRWYHDKDGNLLCVRCYSRLIEYPKRKKYYKEIANPKTHAKWSSKRFHYKGNCIYVDTVLRTGICDNCGKSVKDNEIKRTNLHHSKYDDNDLLAYTVELCVSCHKKAHMVRF